MAKQYKIVKEIANSKTDVKQKTLTKKQRDFVQEYLRNGENATAAAKAAGYTAKTEADFGNIGAQNLRKEAVKEAIKEEKRKIAAAAKAEEEKSGKRYLTANEVLQQLTEIAADTTQRTADRLKALDSLAKYHALYTEKIVQQVDYATIIAESRSRLQSTDIADSQHIARIEPQQLNNIVN